MNRHDKHASALDESRDAVADDMASLDAARLWLQASIRLTRSQADLHAAIFSNDGSEESLERYASARAELDSAEAWALRVAKALPKSS
ncbi:FruA-associating protein, FapA [Corallococcus sp. M34]|uniref:FruA-associating protein, FapA n=1 Tax=Citreicoccus inhibens TaxID=2849499 RepID=UPI0018F48A89|nr:FruA-associating protein, FapA [Citreicoccus inhibens]MBU8898545.1 FruA-associating protein, FapA [Citreicoccus inhibens]